LPLPEEHLRTLNAAVRGHERQIAELRASTQVSDEAIAMHEALIDVLRNGKVVAICEGFYDSQDALGRFAADPHEYLQDEGLTLPDGLSLNGVEVAYEPSTRLTMHASYGAWIMELIWNPDRGFDGTMRQNLVLTSGPMVPTS
jgi:hypothetical protein